MVKVRINSAVFFLIAHANAVTLKYIASWNPIMPSKI